MNQPSFKSLKQQYGPVLWAVVIVDATVLALLTLWPDFHLPPNLPASIAARALLVSAAPVVVLLLNPIVPARIKASLVFWRVADVLPGHRAFSALAAADPRIDLAKLKKNIGEFPSEPKEQNAKWYSLYKKVEGEPSIQHVHRQFLMLRDLAALSIVLLGLVVLASALGAIDSLLGLKAGCLLAIQYLLSALGARFQGAGFVTSVLALHSVKRRV